MTENISGEIMNMLNMALKKEENAYNFYTRAQEMAGLSNVKDLFEELAGEEKKHQEVITSYIEEQKAKGAEWNPAEDLGDTEEVGYTKYLIKIELSEDTTYQDALIIALKREERSYELFSNFYKVAKDEGVKKLFSRLMDDEIRHLKMIEERYDRVISDM